jgi:hypothetical protein
MVGLNEQKNINPITTEIVGPIVNNISHTVRHFAILTHLLLLLSEKTVFHLSIMRSMTPI